MNVREIISCISGKSNFSQIAIEEFAPDGMWASTIASGLREEMNTAQLRKVFHELKRVETQQRGIDDNTAFEDSKIYLLIPQLAYAKARRLITDEFYDLVKVIIGDKSTTKLKTVGDYHRFIEFMTAIVAYQKKKK